MRFVLKARWAVLILWLAAAAGLLLAAPNMEQLVRDKGQITVPDGYTSTMAAGLMKQFQGDAKSGSTSSRELSAVLVFHKDQGFGPSDLDEVKRGIDKLKNGKDAYGVVSVTTHFDTPELKKQMVSADGHTILALVTVDQGSRTAKQTAQALYDALSDVKVEHYYTGNWMIQEDVIDSSQAGLKKTEGITVVFILVILLVVFRSAVAPFIPLLTVGFSYLTSQSIVAYLVKYLDFPLSTFTQIFMVAVLFGIGTDYCILLISRFKEELAHRGDKAEAILATYRTAGRTVLVSGAAVLIGFACIGFSTFVLYRSAVAVAVGIAVMLAALFTLVPFFMMTLGSALFWPARGSLEHKPSRLWGAVGGFSLKRPVWSLLIVAAVTVPFLAVYKGTPSFNSLDEIGSKYASVKAFNIISDSFGPGDSLPSTVVVKSDKPLDSSEGLATIERITRELAKVDGVKSVRSATRPTGEALDDFQVSKQVNQLDAGLGEGTSGLGQISRGLTDAGKALKDNEPKLNDAAQGAKQLMDGTMALKTGIAQLGDGLKRIEQGLKDGTAGAGELKSSLAQAKASADKLAAASRELLGHYQEMGSGLEQLSQAYGDIASKQASLAQGLSDLGQGLKGLGQKYPELQQDPDFLKAQGTVDQLQLGAAQISAGLQQLNGRLDGIAQGLSQANGGLKQAADGQAQLAQGLQALADGIAKLQAGISQAADGQSQAIAKLPAFTGGLDRLASGQKQLSDGFADLNGQLGKLTDGLDQSVDGLSKVTGGLASAQDYLKQLSSAPDKQLTGWFIPDEAIRNADFQKALDTYLSPDRKVAKFDVIFSTNPYDVGTLKKVGDLQTSVDRAVKGTSYAGIVRAVDGATSVNNDLRLLSSKDYSLTVTLMLVGIGIILILLFRSIVIPVYVVLALLLSYYSAMAMAEVLFVRILGLSGLSWPVPFFGFVMLVALGVDYCIFLMDRFKEYRGTLTPQESILEAMKRMGTVIMSAAVILGGTFAAMIPSGVMSLMQIAAIVLCGLFLYTIVILPLFIPVMVRTFGEANWWPLMGRAGREHPASAGGSAQGAPVSGHTSV